MGDDPIAAMSVMEAVATAKGGDVMGMRRDEMKEAFTGVSTMSLHVG